MEHRRLGRPPSLSQRHSRGDSLGAERLSPRPSEQRHASRSPSALESSQPQQRPNSPSYFDPYPSPISLQPEAGPSGRPSSTSPTLQPYARTSPTEASYAKPWSKFRRPSRGSRDFEAASPGAASSGAPSILRSLRDLRHKQSTDVTKLLTSKLARTVLSGLIMLVFLSYIFRSGARRPAVIPPSPLPSVLPKDIWHGGAGSLRDAQQQRLADPESIPHTELLSLTSSVDPQDTALTISVLFAPAANTTPSRLAAEVDQLQRQSRQPTAYFILPSSSAPRALLDLDYAELALPTSSDSDFTLILPLTSQSLTLGPAVLQSLLHLSHTQEFSGALLELGCGQAAFVQTSWLRQLDIKLEFERLSWRKRQSSLRLPLEEKEVSGELDGFHVQGLQTNCEPGQQQQQQQTGQKRGTVMMMLERSTTWDQGWSDLACEFLKPSARGRWSAQAIFMQGAYGSLSCGRHGKMQSSEASRAEWFESVQEADVLVYVLGGFVDLAVRSLSLEERPWTAIGLPERDLASAAFMAALDVEAVRNWHTPLVDVVVITNNRPQSLQRLMDSLQSSHYFGDSVQLNINLEQTADRATHQLVSDVRWKHGSLNLRHRIMLGGLMPAIVESWYPSTNHTYGVFLEDDVEVSPLFYAWLKFTLLHYRYGSSRSHSSRLFGISLYQPKNVELRPEGRQPFDAHRMFAEMSLPANSPYLSQIPCSWGAAYFPETWREFHQYLALRLSEQSIDITDTVVPDVRSNRWPRSWKKYFIEMVYLRGYMMLYPNYPAFESFSTNHLEMGTHIHVPEVELKKKLQFTVPLMADSDSAQLLDLPDHALPSWPLLPVLDLWGGITSEEEVVHRGYSALSSMGHCAEPELARVYDVTRPPTHDAEELLCPRVFEPAVDLDALEQEMAEANAATEEEAPAAR